LGLGTRFSANARRDAEEKRHHMRIGRRTEGNRAERVTRRRTSYMGMWT